MSVVADSPNSNVGEPLQIVLANPRGFCAGVTRAIEIVERALERYGAPVYVRHEIVHNKHVVDQLRSKGAVFVDELSEIPSGAMTIFSAHGVARTVEDEARERNLPTIDATCPLVTKVHFQGRRYAKAGRTLVLIGHPGHAEVIGTMGQIEAPIHLVSTPEDVMALPLGEDVPLAYVTQTTLSIDDTRSVIAALHERFVDVAGPEVSDICYATQNRQTAVRELASISDLLLVVGARNSSNSMRLREIGTEMGVESHLIDDGSAIDPQWLDNVRTVGITAGASAPDELIDSVITALSALRPVAVSELEGVKETIQFRLPPALRYPAAPAAE
ncbi:4-hydroxy-3-methylbut-2-enyl diphosphate reductase [Novosphingobium sp. PhB165]|uniref:4-hydroxy-3-methylbut-2-enyl diphosphate reductase n=1 Tax=Novosphingobium sp. PhB165 TaxID=2485105 RepID=UPI00104C8BF0|nr:4-hydroxy-3-methylbut-2-enyl diphosphate reductase [Novosphingobium sp. PhB165]